MRPPEPPSIAVLSSAAFGGAGIAAMRLHAAFREAGIKADAITLESVGEAVPVDARPEGSFSNRKWTDAHFTVEHFGFCRGTFVELLASYDIINVHWALGLVALAELEALAARGATIVFTSHDFHYVTGGCHYPAGCSLMATGCHPCPQIDTTRADKAIPPRTHRAKAALFARNTVFFTAPSHYVRDKAVASGIVPARRAHVVRNPYTPGKAFDRPFDGSAVRILLIADYLSETRKNVGLALKALAHLPAALATVPDAPAITIDLVGHHDEAVDALLAAIDLPVVRHGRITDHSALTTILSEADILLTPSLEDNWPNILVEAGVYGAAPVTGPGHGCEEFVKTFSHGTVAASYTTTDFCEAIVAEIVGRSEKARADAAFAIRAAHTSQTVVDRFLTLFGEPGLVPVDRTAAAVDRIG